MFDLAALLAVALLLDAVFGEPETVWGRIPHPTVLIGRLIGACDEIFNQGDFQRLKGIAVIAVLAVTMVGWGWLFAQLPFGWLWSLTFAFVFLAQKSLVDHVRAVADGLSTSLEDGRSAVALIVGRQTDDMSEADVSRAAIESGAENLSDGVVAPAFWFLIAGLPGLLLYKMTNTADSMIGHKTDRHKEFGWAAAKLDDVLNWIPARLTAGLIALGHRGAGAWTAARKDAPHHRSPNAGWPEAAMAKVLGIALSGPRQYEDQLTNDPFLNADGRRDANRADITRAVQVLWRTWGLMLMPVIILAAIGSVF